MEAATFSQDLTLNLKEQQIFDILKRARELRLGEDPKNQLVLRVNGGWVRDKLLGRDSIDIDISLDTLTGVQFTKYVLEAYKQISPQTCTQNKNSDVRPPAPKTEHLQTATIQLEELLESTMKQSTFEKVKQPVLLLYYYKDEDHQDDVVKVSAMKRMFSQLSTPENLKRQVALPNTGNHVLGSPIKSKDVASVQKECELFAVEVLKLIPPQPPVLLGPKIP